MPPLLDVRHLTIQFPAEDRGAPATAVRDLSFSLSRGEVLGLVGESGSGKSLTSLALMRLLPPQAEATGEIAFSDGEGPPLDLLRVPEDDMHRLRGLRIAMIFQEPM